MAKVTRRAFLQTSVGAATGVAAAGAAGLATTGLVASVVGATHAEADDTVVAYVRRGSKGDVTLMVGDREIAKRDPDLVNRLLRAAR